MRKPKKGYLSAFLVAPSAGSILPGYRVTNTIGREGLTSYLGASVHESNWKEKDSPLKLRWKSCSAELYTVGMGRRKWHGWMASEDMNINQPGNTFLGSDSWTDLVGWKQGGRAFLHTQLSTLKFYRNLASEALELGWYHVLGLSLWAATDDERNQMDLAYLQDGLHRKTGQSVQWWELWPES